MSGTSGWIGASAFTSTTKTLLLGIEQFLMQIFYFKMSVVHFQNYSVLLTYMELMLKCSWLFRDLNLGHWLLKNISKADSFHGSCLLS